MEKYCYSTEELFGEILAHKQYKRGTEGDIYFLEDSVLKVFDHTYYSKNESTIEKIGELDPTKLTIPQSLLYVDSEYAGYYMQNAGENVESLLGKQKLSYADRINVAQSLKEISLYLKQKGMAHGDISFSNIFKDSEYIRLGDVNNLIIGSSTPRLNLLARYWYKYYHNYQLVDTLSINYLTYLLLLYKAEDLEWIVKNVIFTTRCLDMLVAEETTIFEQDAWEQEKRLLFTDVRQYNGEMDDLYLIDYIK